MDSLEFEKIQKEVLDTIFPIFKQRLRAPLQEIKIKARNYPDQIPTEQVIEEIQKYFVFAMEVLLTEAARVSTLIVQKYHQRLLAQK